MTVVKSSVIGASRAATAARDDGLLLELSGISKYFPGVVALDGVDFDLRRGEVHVLFGENGAGKSTLINVIAGTYPPDAGDFKFQGEDVGHLTPHMARIIGISPVFQEFSLVPDLTVEQNLFLGRELTKGGFLDRIGDARQGDRDHRDARVRSRPRPQGPRAIARPPADGGDRQGVADRRPLLILDEPTASLTEAEAAKLFDLVAKLKASGVGIIYVSHRMREIKQIADRITVLRDGRKITTVHAKDVQRKRVGGTDDGAQDRRAVSRTSTTRPGEKLLEIERPYPRRPVGEQRELLRPRR